MNTKNLKIAILGGGNIGIALAQGLVKAGQFEPGQITITRRSLRVVESLAREGYGVTDNNPKAVDHADIIVIAVLPQQLNNLLDEIKPHIDKKKHLLISVVSGVSIRNINERLESEVEVIRAMPNTAIAVRESMTCIAYTHASKENITLTKAMFDAVGITIEINEELMTSATALCACGIAFFLRAIRAASQGGVEIGFHAEEALLMAAQTAKGAATLLGSGAHPENEIDKVTSPKGCTIAGLNEMEHNGFSSALIKGIRISSRKAGELYVNKD